MKQSNPVRIMGVINVSPESFFKGSVRTSARDVARAAEQMEKDGADMIDIGAMSTAPYLKTKISETEEAHRLSYAVRAVRKASRLPISIDTSRAAPAMAGLEAGATILNDVSGLSADPALVPLLKKFREVILMAPSSPKDGFDAASPIDKVKSILRNAVNKAVAAGFPRRRITVDPGIGFFRDERIPWWKWDMRVLRDLKELKTLRLPILIGVSRKSFLAETLNAKDPTDRLAGSLAAAVWAVSQGATLVRTHDVKETRDALRIFGGLSGLSGGVRF